MKILITGTSKGVGHILANALLQEGHNVIGVARSESAINHPSYLHIKADLGEASSVESVLAKIDELDALINCAAVAHMNPFLLSEASDLEKMLKVNLVAPYLFSRECAKKMISGNGGRIINISSMASHLNIPGELHYTLTKTALEKMTQLTAKELAPYKITVNALGLSLVKTDLLKGLSEKQLQELKKNLPYPEFLEKEDLMHAIRFLLDEKSRYISGQLIFFGGIC